MQPRRSFIEHLPRMYIRTTSFSEDIAAVHVNQGATLSEKTDAVLYVVNLSSLHGVKCV